MKLAEALKERADLLSRIGQLKSRAVSYALTQEGLLSPDDPKALLGELDDCVRRLESLISAINLTNCTLKVGERTMTECLAQRDALRLQLEAYRAVLNEVGSVNFRARGSEIKFEPALNVKELTEQTDKLAQELRLLDNQIQSANWSCELRQE